MDYLNRQEGRSRSGDLLGVTGYGWNPVRQSHNDEGFCFVADSREKVVETINHSHKFPRLQRQGSVKSRS